MNNISSVNGSLLNTGIYNPTKLGNVEGGFSIPSANAGLDLPFLRGGTEPEDADIKAGPIYVKFHSLDGLVLYDDNYQRTETDRRSEILVLLRLNLSVIAQLTDNLQFAVSGSIDYLPIQNQVGIETSAFSSLGLLFSAVPAFAAQLVDDTVIAGWPVLFADDFRVNTGSYSNSVRDNFDLFHGDYLDRNEAGGYYFHSRPNQRGYSALSTQNNLNDSVLYFTNIVSAYTDRLLPGDVRLTLRLSHENYWYNQDNRGLPPAGTISSPPWYRSGSNQAFFKPFVNYDARLHPRGPPNSPNPSGPAFQAPSTTNFFSGRMPGIISMPTITMVSFAVFHSTITRGPAHPDLHRGTQSLRLQRRGGYLGLLSSPTNSRSHPRRPPVFEYGNSTDLRRRWRLHSHRRNWRSAITLVFGTKDHFEPPESASTSNMPAE